MNRRWSWWMNCWGSNDGFRIKGGVVVCVGMEQRYIINWFRCSGISISMIFPWSDYCVTQTTQIRHPWLRLRLFGASSPEIAGCLMGISRNTNSLPKSPIYNIPLFHAAPNCNEPLFVQRESLFPPWTIVFYVQSLRIGGL